MNKDTTEFSALKSGQWFIYHGEIYMCISPIHDKNGFLFNAIGIDGIFTQFRDYLQVRRIKARFYSLDREDYEKT